MMKKLCTKKKMQQAQLALPFMGGAVAQALIEHKPRVVKALARLLLEASRPPGAEGVNDDES